MAVRRVDDVATANAHVSGVEVRNVKRAEGAELKVIDVEPGSATPFHTHPHAHEAVIVSGNGAVRLQDGERPLAAGDVLSVGPEEPHAILGRGGDPCGSCAWIATRRRKADPGGPAPEASGPKFSRRPARPLRRLAGLHDHAGGHVVR